MPNKRKNKCRSGKRSPPKLNQPWFTKNLARQRRRNKVAKLSRRKNRG